MAISLSAGLGSRRTDAIPLHRRSIIAATLATVIGLVCFLWPFLTSPNTFGATYTPALMFGILLVLVLAVVFAQVADGGIDSKAIAMLGVLSAVNAGLRPLGAGTAGIETIFFLLVLAGRVYGPGFGFALGCTSLFASAVITGSVGPWVPYQMFGCAWIGLFAGLLPRCRGKIELAMLAAYGVLAGYAYGFLLNLQFWPFSVDPGSSISYHPGAAFLVQWHRYLVFDATTSLGFDTGRAITDLICILVLGPAVLATLRRASRKANFQAPVQFHQAADAQQQLADSESQHEPQSATGELSRTDLPSSSGFESASTT